jgi:hypothetical protein
MVKFLFRISLLGRCGLRSSTKRSKLLQFVGQSIDATQYRPRISEGDIASIGPKAIGGYGEMVAKNFLESHGLLLQAQYPYRDVVGNLRLADFYNSSTEIAFEVKTGKFGLNLIHEFKIEPFLFAINSKQFRRVIFVNVMFLGRVGFAEAIRKRIRSFETITLC